MMSELTIGFTESSLLERKQMSDSKKVKLSKFLYTGKQQSPTKP